MIWSCRVALVVRYHRHITIMDDFRSCRVAFDVIAATTAHHSLCEAHFNMFPAPCGIGLMLQDRPTLRPTSSPPHDCLQTSRECRLGTQCPTAPEPDEGRPRQVRERGVGGISLSSPPPGQPTDGGCWRRWGCGIRRRRRRSGNQTRCRNRSRRRRIRRRRPRWKPQSGSYRVHSVNRHSLQRALPGRRRRRRLCRLNGGRRMATAPGGRPRLRLGRGRRSGRARHHGLASVSGLGSGRRLGPWRLERPSALSHEAQPSRILPYHAKTVASNRACNTGNRGRGSHLFG